MKDNSDILLEKKYSIKELNISYRILNNWSDKGLVNHLRAKKGEWHRFSAIELIETEIYNELRQFGFSLKKLLSIKDFLNEQYEDLSKFINHISGGKEQGTITHLVINLLPLFSGERRYLVCDRDATNPTFLDDLSTAEVIAGTSPLCEEIYQGNNSIVIVDLRRIIDLHKIFETNRQSKLGLVLSTLLDSDYDSETKILSSKNGRIKKTKHIIHRSLEKGENVNKLARQKNQNISFSNNNNGSTIVKIEKEII